MQVHAGRCWLRVCGPQRFVRLFFLLEKCILQQASFLISRFILTSARSAFIIRSPSLTVILGVLECIKNSSNTATGGGWGKSTDRTACEKWSGRWSIRVAVCATRPLSSFLARTVDFPDLPWKSVGWLPRPQPPLTTSRKSGLVEKAALSHD